MINFLVVPFDRGSDGVLLRGEALKAPNASVAKTWAKAMAASHVGAIALMRKVEDVTGADHAGTLISAFGDVELKGLDIPL